MVVVDGKNFELFFTEKNLKSGFRYFEKGKIDLSSKVGTEYNFLVADNNVKFRKKADEINNVSCTCREGKCAHLAAALFFLYKDQVDLKKGQRLKTSKNQTVVKLKKDDVFISLHQRFHQIIQPFSVAQKMDTQSIEKLVENITAFKHRYQNDNLRLNLVIFAEFGSILSLRFIGDESPLLKIFNDVKEAVTKSIRKGLNQIELNSLYEATKLSIRSNNMLHCDSYQVLVPAFLVSVNHLEDIRNIALVLSKRKGKTKYSESFNQLEICRLQAEIRLCELESRPFKLAAETGGEVFIARASLYFFEHNHKKAFNVLIKNHDIVKHEFKLQYIEYLDYIISNAKTYNESEIEARFLKERMIFGLFLTEGQLDRFIHLLPFEKRTIEYDQLIKEIKRSQDEYAFDKLSFLLMREKRYDELIQEIKRHKNQFHLLHTVALKKLPDFPANLLLLYAERLSEALHSARYYQLQQSLFITATEIISELRKDQKDNLINRVLDKLGHQAQIARYITSLEL